MALRLITVDGRRQDKIKCSFCNRNKADEPYLPLVGDEEVTICLQCIEECKLMLRLSESKEEQDARTNPKSPE